MLVRCCYHSIILYITMECTQENGRVQKTEQLLIKNAKCAKLCSISTNCTVSKLDTRVAQKMTTEQVNSLSNEVLKRNSNH